MCPVERNSPKPENREGDGVTPWRAVYGDEAEHADERKRGEGATGGEYPHPGLLYSMIGRRN